MMTLSDLLAVPASASTTARLPASALRSASAAAADAVGLSSLTHLWETLTDTATSDGAAPPTGPGFVARGVFYPVRTLTADDTDMLSRFLSEGLSDQSRMTRFHTATPVVPASAAAWLARRDGRERVALLALDPDDPSTIAGMAEYAVGPGYPSPEVAFAVADAFHGKGIATQLVRMLATLSVAGGHTVWVASVLEGNVAALATLATVGDVSVRAVGAGELEVTVTVDPGKLFGAGL